MQIILLGALLICTLAPESYSWRHGGPHFSSGWSWNQHHSGGHSTHSLSGSSHWNSDRRCCCKDLKDALFRQNLTDPSGVDSGLGSSPESPAKVTDGDQATGGCHYDDHRDRKNSRFAEKEILKKCAQENNITIGERESCFGHRWNWIQRSRKGKHEIQEGITAELPERDSWETDDNDEEGDDHDDKDDDEKDEEGDQHQRKRRHSSGRWQKCLPQKMRWMEMVSEEKISNVSKCILSEFNIINSNNQLNIDGISSAISTKFGDRPTLLQELQNNLKTCNLQDNYNITALFTCIQEPCMSLSDGSSNQ